ncbi:histidinol-phosphate transaminase [Clostridiaceae bacterium M8S5]|nr:histidinol-phosphate transaminase [Clostridiaceae bacterium M8S5]
MPVSFRKEIKDLVAYKPGKPIEDVKREYGLSDVIKLASNENPLGASPKVKEAMLKVMEEFSLYPDGNCTELKEAISKKYNVKPSEVLPSAGSDEMVDMIAKTFINHGDEIIMADITFPRYMDTARIMGGTPVLVPLKNWTYDLEGMLAKITDKTKIIWLCNPNNPTGTMFSEKALLDFLKQVPENILVIYDEAYNEFVTRDDYPKDSVQLLKDYPNVLILKTFSKMYGLASLRVGYTIASEEIISNINKVRCPFDVNRFAQAAAIAALEDQDFVKKCYDLNKRGKEYLYSEFEKLGYEYIPSETNHIMANVEKNSGEVFLELQKRGVIIRPMMSTWIRVSIGTMPQNETFIEKLKEVLAPLGGCENK